MEGYGLTIDAPRVRLALVRDDLEEVKRLFAASTEAMYFAQLAATATKLDALAVLGDRGRVEQEALPLLRPKTYLEPSLCERSGSCAGTPA